MKARIPSRRPLDGMAPLSKEFYNAQYAINKQQWAQCKQPAFGGGGNDLPQLPDHTQDPEGRYCTLLAAGDDHSFRVRTARVIALAELFWFFGDKYTARELYAYYVNARRLVLTRPHSDANWRVRSRLSRPLAAWRLCLWGLDGSLRPGGGGGPARIIAWQRQTGRSSSK